MSEAGESGRSGGGERYIASSCTGDGGGNGGNGNDGDDDDGGVGGRGSKVGVGGEETVVVDRDLPTAASLIGTGGGRPLRKAERSESSSSILRR